MSKHSDYPIKSIIFGDKNYPKSLAEIKNPPKALFYRGDIGKLPKKRIAIVGSRRMTRYGKEIIDRFVSSFVAEKVATISGFMYGVDTEVHQQTVEYGGGTIAVFGCGLDVVYPPENEELYGEILDNSGLVISEYEPKAKPHLWKFPQRNRIVAGLSTLGVLVIEAGENSGSLITAKIAKEQGKKVYAVPGVITSAVSVGTNWLIKEGMAELVTVPGEILEIRGQGLGHKERFYNLDPLERKIVEVLERESLNVDEIAATIGKGVVEVGTTLSMMGIKGMVSESGGKFYVSR